MSTLGFFPTTESWQIVWLTYYTLKLPVNAPLSGISAKEPTAYKQLMIGGNGSGSIEYPKPTVFPNPPAAPAPGIQKRLFSQIARIKASLNYNEAIGKDLGIIAIPDTVDHPFPEFWLTVEMGLEATQVRIDFKKYGHDGIWIESRTNGGEWAFLAIDTVKPYLDGRPLALGNTSETREYRMRWWDKSEAHGEWTGIQKAVLGT